MGEFDKINNGMIVNNFNQLSNRRDCEIFCTKYHKLEHSSNMYFTDRSLQNSQVGESSACNESDQFGIS